MIDVEKYRKEIGEQLQRGEITGRQYMARIIAVVKEWKVEYREQRKAERDQLKAEREQCRAARELRRAGRHA
jgi:hypothetical protein